MTPLRAVREDLCPSGFQNVTRVVSVAAPRSAALGASDNKEMLLIIS